jgi:hypothetical protein
LEVYKNFKDSKMKRKTGKNVYVADNIKTHLCKEHKELFFKDTQISYG